MNRSQNFAPKKSGISESIKEKKYMNTQKHGEIIGIAPGTGTAPDYINCRKTGRISFNPARYVNLPFLARNDRPD